MKYSIDKNKGNHYDKIKHLVEVDYDILAVFIVMSSQIKELYIAKNSHIDRGYVDSIVKELDLNLNIDVEDKELPIEKTEVADKSILGKINWIVLEYDNFRIIKLSKNIL